MALRHWLVDPHGEREPVQIVRDEAEAQMYRDAGWTVQGPFLLGAVEALESIRDHLRPFVEGGEPAAEDACDIYEIANHALDR